MPFESLFFLFFHRLTAIPFIAQSNRFGNRQSIQYKASPLANIAKRIRSDSYAIYLYYPSYNHETS